MRWVELKNIVDRFLKSVPEENTEKAPIVGTYKTFQDHGAILKDSDMNKAKDSESLYYRRLSEEKSTTESGEEMEKKPKMSILRKLCFLLSLNGGVLYVAAFLWLIPCRQPFCLNQQQDWTITLNGLLTSNMEATSSTGQLSSVVFGYSDEIGGNIGSFSTSDGEMKWNKRTKQILRNIFCHYNQLHEVKTEGIAKCIATGYNYIAAFDDSNGNLVWERNITDPDGETIHEVALIGNSANELYLLGVSDSFIFTLDAKNGSQVSMTKLPCSWTIDIKLVGPWEAKNKLWTLLCEYGDSIEVWTFEEKEVLNTPPQRKSGGKNHLRNQEKFSLLFSLSRSTAGSMSLTGDVTRTPDSLVLSWADRVVMVTAQAPSHRPTRAWEVRSWGTRGDALSVTSILYGHFTDPKENQIAVAVQGEFNATVYILEAKNGTSVMSTDLGSRSVMSMEKITGGKAETDVIVIESVHKMNFTNADDTMTDTISAARTYFTMQYNPVGVIYENIVKADVIESILIPNSVGAASLFIASRQPDGNTTLTRHVVTSSHQELVCHWGSHMHNTTVLLLD